MLLQVVPTNAVRVWWTLLTVIQPVQQCTSNSARGKEKDSDSGERTAGTGSVGLKGYRFLFNIAPHLPFVLGSGVSKNRPLTTAYPLVVHPSCFRPFRYISIETIDVLHVTASPRTSIGTVSQRSFHHILLRRTLEA